jgi:hypothetical protein
VVVVVAAAVIVVAGGSEVVVAGGNVVVAGGGVVVAGSNVVVVVAGADVNDVDDDVGAPLRARAPQAAVSVARAPTAPQRSNRRRLSATPPFPTTNTLCGEGRPRQEGGWGALPAGPAAADGRRLYLVAVTR